MAARRQGRRDVAEEKQLPQWVISTLRWCLVAVVGVGAQLTCALPVQVARPLLRFYRRLIDTLPLHALDLGGLFDALDFHLLSQAEPDEALAVLESRIDAHPQKPFVCADYAMAAQLCEKLSLHAKAVDYYQRALETAPSASTEFRQGMVQRIERLKAAT